MKKWKIEYYTTEAGHVPVRDFIDDMPIKAKAKTFHTFVLIEEYGPLVGEPHVKYLEKGLWEIRISALEGIYRLMFTTVKGKIIILLHGFQKKSQKTPLGELRTARARLREVK
ncbi:MAG: type II toxin-antitoxin system RelE/ParE family toxin [Actinomycetota bacterium]